MYTNPVFALIFMILPATLIIFLVDFENMMIAFRVYKRKGLWKIETMSNKYHFDQDRWLSTVLVMSMPIIIVLIMAFDMNLYVTLLLLALPALAYLINYMCISYLGLIPPTFYKDGLFLKELRLYEGNNEDHKYGSIDQIGIVYHFVSWEDVKLYSLEDTQTDDKTQPFRLKIDFIDYRKHDCRVTLTVSREYLNKVVELINNNS